jgi:hypothetical protein
VSQIYDICLGSYDLVDSIDSTAEGSINVKRPVSSRDPIGRNERCDRITMCRRIRERRGTNTRTDLGSEFARRRPENILELWPNELFTGMNGLLCETVRGNAFTSSCEDL